MKLLIEGLADELTRALKEAVLEGVCLPLLSLSFARYSFKLCLVLIGASAPLGGRETFSGLVLNGEGGGPWDLADLADLADLTLVSEGKGGISVQWPNEVYSDGEEVSDGGVIGPGMKPFLRSVEYGDDLA